MSDQRFFDLAIKAIAHQATDAERAELDALLASQPDLRGEFARLEADAPLVRKILPLIKATEATAPELPDYVRERLQSKVRQTLGRPQISTASAGGEERRMVWRWQWMLGLVAATAVVALVMVPLLRQASAPVILIAMLDTAGASRGSEANELALLQQTWITSSPTPVTYGRSFGIREYSWR